MKINCKFGITATVNEAVAKSEKMSKAVYEAVARFVNFDFGKVPEEDSKRNAEDWLNRDGHILGRYSTPEGDIYINLEFAEIPEEDTAVILYVWEW